MPPAQSPTPSPTPDPAADRARDLEGRIWEVWEETDAQAVIEVRLRPDGKFDLRVVSTRFEGLDSTQRENLFWSRIRRLPTSLTVRMTYALLLTPEEAKDYFEEPGDE